MTEIILKSDVPVLHGVLKKGTKIQYEGEIESVYNFYINGVRVENRLGQLKRILTIDLHNRKSKNLLKRRA